MSSVSKYLLRTCTQILSLFYNSAYILHAHITSFLNQKNLPSLLQSQLNQTNENLLVILCFWCWTVTIVSVVCLSGCMHIAGLCLLKCSARECDHLRNVQACFHAQGAEYLCCICKRQQSSTGQINKFNQILCRISFLLYLRVFSALKRCSIYQRIEPFIRCTLQIFLFLLHASKSKRTVMICLFLYVFTCLKI